MTPAWILDLLAAVMLAVAALSAARLVTGRPWRRGSVLIDTDVSHLLMGIAMAGMLTSRLTTLPGGAWEAIFGGLIAWFAFRVTLDARVSGVRALAGGHCAPHLVHSAAMLYMFLALGPGPSAAGMDGMSGAGAMTLSHPTLAFAFTLALIGYTVWDLDQLSGRRPSPAAVRVAPAGVGPGSGIEVSTAPIPGRAVTSGFLMSPAVTVGARVTMGVVMAFLLIIAI